MVDKSYFNLIANNPLYVHSNIDNFNTTINNISNNIKLDNKIFYNAIKDLRQQEDEIYRTLGNGNKQKGKEILTEIAKNIYTNNDFRKRVITLTQQLFGRLNFLSLKSEDFLEKILDENGELFDLKKYEKEEKRLIKRGTNIDNQIKFVPLNVSFNINKDTGEKNITARRGKSEPPKDPQEVQNLIDLYCSTWNDVISKYNGTIDEILSLMQEKSIENKKSVTRLREYFKNLEKELSLAKENEKINTSKLSDNFYKLIAKKGGVLGNIIGLFTEYCKYEVSKEVSTQLNEFSLQLKFIRGDDISRELTKSSTNAKADGIFVIKGDLNLPEDRITLPVSLKFRSDSIFKAHSGTISSISELIKKENENYGDEYSNYFKYLLINYGRWQFSTKNKNEIIKQIIMTILNNYSYVFISGGLKENNLSKAIFISGTFLEENDYENYFFPTSRLLYSIYKNLKDKNGVLDWTAWTKIQNQFNSRESSEKKYESYNKNKNKVANEIGSYNYDELAINELMIASGETMFRRLSSLVKSTNITFNHKIITGTTKGNYYSIFGGSNGVIL